MSSPDPNRPALARAIPALLCFLLLNACEEDQVVTTTRNLDRPGGLALVCAGRAGDAGVTTGLSPSACTSDGGGGSLYGFVANTGRGEVAVFRAGASGEPLIDLDPGSPGFGFIPVGGLPTDIKATPDNCRIVTANQGSCDLSLVDVPGVLKLSAEELTTPYAGLVSRVIPRTKSGRLLRARPQELVLVPSSVPDKGQAACPASPGYRAYVTFPGCNLLAEIDLKTGVVLQGLVIGRNGFYPTDEPSCPVECTIRGDKGRVDAGPLDYGAPPDLPAASDIGGGEAPQGPSDAGVTDGPADGLGGPGDGPMDGAPDAPAPDGPGLDGGPADASSDPGSADQGSGGVRPFGIAVTAKGDRIYVSSANAGFITVLDVDETSGDFTGARRIPLADDVATTKVRLSPEPRNPKVGRFLYAIAMDRSVRVIAVDLEKECETSPDLAAIDAGTVPLEVGRCLVLGAKDTPPRRVTQQGTGLRFGTRIPEEISFIKSNTPPADAGTTDARPTATPLYGIYVMVAVSDGSVYIVDLEDWSFVGADATALSTGHLPHRFRNGLQGTEEGAPDASVGSVSGAGNGGVPVVVSEVVTSGSDGGVPLPGEGVLTRGPGEAIAATWDMVYEQRLVGRWSGNLEVQADRLQLADRGANFCKAGVLGRLEDSARRPLRHGDIVVLLGCEDDDGCGLDQVCVKPVTQQTETGLCFDKDRQDELFQHCADYLRGKRELLVTRAAQDQLVLDALPVEPQAVVRQPSQPAGGCTDNADCQAGFYCALEARTVTNRPDLTIDKGECFRPGCVRDEDCGSGHCVQPLRGGGKICAAIPLPLETGPSCKTDDDCEPTSNLGISCSTDKDCGDSRLECRRVSNQITNKTCVDREMVCTSFPGVGKKLCVSRSSCFNELLHYEVYAGRSFIVGGYHRTIADPSSGECVEDPAKSPLLTWRVPIGPAATYPALLGQRCDAPVGLLALPSPNPCFERPDTGYVGFTDPGTSPPSTVTRVGPATVVRFSNPDIWLSLGVNHLTNIVATDTPTDAGVGATTASNLPERGLTISLAVNSGYSRMRTATQQVFALPVRIVEGPDDYVYIVDIGNLSGSTGANGQVRRLERGDLTLDDFIVR